MSEPLTYEWLRDHGWRLLPREERQPTDHVRLDVGGELLGGRPLLGAADDLGIELAAEAEGGGWFCWVTQREPRRHIHVRRVFTTGEVIRLWEGLTGREWRGAA